MPTLVIATRESELALWQSNHVKHGIETHHPEVSVNLLPMTTQGDQLLDTPLYQSGGKGLFVKELETALLDGRADIAVHSMKDVPVALPAGLGIHALLPRADRRDALVSQHYDSLDALPTGACVGTSSLRRQALLQHLRPDLNIRLLRGNVNTRIRKLDEGQYDAIILACAGLDRLGWQTRIVQRLDPLTFIPAPGQGIVGIECRNDDTQTRAWLTALHDANSAIQLAAERGCNARLEGGCHSPVGMRCDLTDNELKLHAFVGNLTENSLISSEHTIIRPTDPQAACMAAQQLGETVADELLAQGAAAWLANS